MSQKCGTVDGEGGQVKAPLTVESLQRYLAAQAEDRDAATERTESFLSRFFKLAVVIVCLNVVIAGANIAMILLRSNGAHEMPVSTPATASTAESARPAAEPQVAIAAPAAQVVEPPQPSPPLAVAAAAPPAPAVAVQAKRVPLLGPLPSAPKSAPILAKRAAPPAKPTFARPVLANEDTDEAPDDRPPAPPERW